MTADCVSHCCTRGRRRDNRSSVRSILSSSGSAQLSNPHSEQTEVLASSVEWLNNRVEILLTSLDSAAASQSEPLSQEVSFVSTSSFSTFRASAVSLDDPSGGAPQPERVVRQSRRKSLLLLHRLLKRLQGFTRNPYKVVHLVQDEDFCRLLPLTICSSYFDVKPATELLLARTLSNMSCHQNSCGIFCNNNFICNLIDGWTSSPCLVLSLCGRKIAANLSTFILLDTLSPGFACRPSCIYQPDVYELSRPFLAVPLMDVVFVNGMLGSVFYTWKQGGDDSQEEASSCWPRDWLPADLPKARVLALNMKIQPIKWRGCRSGATDPSACLPRRANEALTQLIAAGVGNRPTAFVCHSFGGLIVKQMLQVLHLDHEDPARRRLLANVRGVAFVAVPHLGRSKAVNVNRCYWRPVRRFCLSDEASNVFDRSCRVLSRLHAWFVQYAQTRVELRVLNLIELDRTPIAGSLRMKVCPETWADKLVGDVIRIPTDHILICKPPNRQHESYLSILRFLGELANYSGGWRPALLAASGSAGGGGGLLSSEDWRKPVRNCEEELRLRYGVSSAKSLWTSSEWLKFRAKNRPRFYDML